MDPSPTDRDPDKDDSFESLLSQLEEIIHRVETGEVGLERSIAEYERGVGLVRRCRDILTQAEQRVDELSRSLASPDAGPAAGDDEPKPARKDKPGPGASSRGSR